MDKPQLPDDISMEDVQNIFEDSQEGIKHYARKSTPSDVLGEKSSFSSAPPRYIQIHSILHLYIKTKMSKTCPSLFLQENIGWRSVDTGFWPRWPHFCTGRRSGWSIFKRSFFTSCEAAWSGNGLKSGDESEN